jgi:hypothetical protein
MEQKINFREKINSVCPLHPSIFVMICRLKKAMMNEGMIKPNLLVNKKRNTQHKMPTD